MLSTNELRCCLIFKRRKSYDGEQGIFRHNYICCIQLFLPCKTVVWHSPMMQSTITDDSDLDNNVEVVSDYINFCEDMIIPKKEVKCYPNNKPWVTKGLKETINKKKSAMAKKDKLALKTVGNELIIKIRSSKDQFKHKLEAKFKSTNTKEAWLKLEKTMV